jgi:hypothetical protein
MSEEIITKKGHLCKFQRNTSVVLAKDEGRMRELLVFRPSSFTQCKSYFQTNSLDIGRTVVNKYFFQDGDGEKEE